MNDTAYCSILQSREETAEVERSLCFEEIICQLYDLVKGFQMQMGISRWQELHSQHCSLIIKLFFPLYIQHAAKKLL